MTPLRTRGYVQLEREAIRIEGWPVQFLPVGDALDAEALAAAVGADFGNRSTSPPCGCFARST